MEKIYVKDLLVDGSYPAAGEKLYDKGVRFISQGQVIFLDMSDVDSVPTTFMNVSFGRFINEYGKDNTKKALRFLNITRSQLERIKRYFDTYE